MPDKHLFEYAVIRIVPRVEREEFMNVGIILFCPSLQYLHSTYELNKDRLLALCPAIEMEELARRLASFQQICAGSGPSGPIGRLPAASRFRWLTSTRSTVERFFICRAAIRK